MIPEMLRSFDNRILRPAPDWAEYEDRWWHDAWVALQAVTWLWQCSTQPVIQPAKIMGDTAQRHWEAYRDDERLTWTFPNFWAPLMLSMLLITPPHSLSVCSSLDAQSYPLRSARLLASASSPVSPLFSIPQWSSSSLRPERYVNDSSSCATHSPISAKTLDGPWSCFPRPWKLPP